VPRHSRCAKMCSSPVRRVTTFSCVTRIPYSVHRDSIHPSAWNKNSLKFSMGVERSRVPPSYWVPVSPS
jgi:hypothetical protein